MRKKESKREAIRALEQWLGEVSHAELEFVEDGAPSPAADRMKSVLAALRLGIQEERLFVTHASRGARSPVGPMMVLLDEGGAVIVGTAGPGSGDDELPAPLRQRFTWP